MFGDRENVMITQSFSLAQLYKDICTMGRINGILDESRGLKFCTCLMRFKQDTRYVMRHAILLTFI